jgi:hypothetical protein
VTTAITVNGERRELVASDVLALCKTWRQCERADHGNELGDLKMNLQGQLREYSNERNAAMQRDLLNEAVKHVARHVPVMRVESSPSHYSLLGDQP